MVGERQCYGTKGNKCLFSLREIALEKYIPNVGTISSVQTKILHYNQYQQYGQISGAIRQQYRYFSAKTNNEKQ